MVGAASTAWDISIHIPRVGDDRRDRSDDRYRDISIHIPRVGDDISKALRCYFLASFQSTSPVWGMTRLSIITLRGIRISIHIPRVGDDASRGILFSDFGISIHIPRVGDDTGLPARSASNAHFNPHPPCGG